MMMAVLAAMCMTTFTACGGDDDDDIPGQDVPGTVTYYEPCFDWGKNTDHVKAYMSGWELVDGSNDYALLYQNGKRIERSSDPAVERAQHLQIVISDVRELEKRIARTSLEIQKYQKRLDQ